MGLQVLSVKQVHKIEDATGLSVARATVNNAWQWRIWFFVTNDHKHGSYDRTNGDWSLHAEQDSHWSSCAQIDGREPHDPSRWTTCHRGHQHLTN